VTASQDLLAGRDFLAKQDNYYVYPPFFTMICTPFTLLPQALSQFIFYVVSCACIVYVVRSAWALSGGGRLEGAGAEVQPKEHLVFLLALFCAGRFLLNALSHLQTDLLVAALVMAGCMALRANRSFVAASWIGLATAMKCTPVLFAPYLAWRGKWLAALWLVTLAVGVNFLPDLVNRPPSGGFWAVEWYTRYVVPLEQADSVPGTWHNSPTDNQSLAGAVRRVFTTSIKWSKKGVEVVKSNSTASPKVLRWITFSLYAMVTIPSAFALWRRRRAADPRSRKPSPDALEFSIIFLLMLLLSPNSSRGHFGIMLLPALCVGRIAVSEHDRTAWALFLLATFVSLISYNTPFNILHLATLWLGATCFVAVLLLAGCILALPGSNAVPQQPPGVHSNNRQTRVAH
jgi:hypothetical protein